MKRHNTAMLGIGLLVGTQACSGGESTCLKIFCNDVVRVNFVPPLTEPGSYVFDLTADDRTTHCAVSSGDDLASSFFPDKMQCDIPDIPDPTIAPHAGITGNSEEPWAVDAIWFHALATRTVKLRVTRDGTVIREKAFVPHPRFETYPCDNRCGTVELEL